MSARAQRSKSIGSTFSSIRVTVCPAGVRAASKGRQATGMLARLPKKRQGVLHAPVGDLEPGVDQDDVGHGPAPPGGQDRGRGRPPFVSLPEGADGTPQRMGAHPSDRGETDPHANDTEDSGPVCGPQRPPRGSRAESPRRCGAAKHVVPVISCFVEP